MKTIRVITLLLRVSSFELAFDITLPVRVRVFFEPSKKYIS